MPLDRSAFFLRRVRQFGELDLGDLRVDPVLSTEPAATSAPACTGPMATFNGPALR
jgi:hypothetical protein